MEFKAKDQRNYGPCTASWGAEVCGRPSALKRDLLCSAHHQQKKAGVAFREPRSYAPGAPCKFPGCPRLRFSRGWCTAHYQQERSGRVEMIPIGSYKRGTRSWVRNEKGEKKCTGCKKWLNITKFSSRSASKGDQLNSRCKKCTYWGYIQANYRTSQERFLFLLESQGGKCAVCREKLVLYDASTHLDHNHGCCPGSGSCGECVRGVLCNNCNVGLGLFGDDPRKLQGAIDYLKEKM